MGPASKGRHRAYKGAQRECECETGQFITGYMSKHEQHDRLLSGREVHSNCTKNAMASGFKSLETDPHTKPHDTACHLLRQALHVSAICRIKLGITQAGRRRKCLGIVPAAINIGQVAN
jgi:hypothetical protein